MSGAPLPFLSLPSRLLKANGRERALERVEIVHKGNAVVELEAANSLIVELKNTLPELSPKHKPIRREFHNPRTFVFWIGHPLNKTVALKALQNSIQILTADDEKIRQGAN